MTRSLSIASIAVLAITSAYATPVGINNGHAVKRCDVCGGLSGYGSYGGGFGFPYAASFTNAFNTNTNTANYNDDTLYANNQNANVFNTNTNAYNNANVVA